ncbi:MAG: methyltransferase domain-containing protein [Patescibacteria group bacterium]
MSSLLTLATDPHQYEGVDGKNWQDTAVDAASPRNRLYLKYLEGINWHGKKILDVGSGTGWLYPHLMQTGATSVRGIEPAHNHVALSRKNHPEFEVFEGTLDEYETNEQFDAILFIMVLVHIGDIGKTFEKASQLLSPSGKIIAMVTHFYENSETRAKRNGKEYDVEIIDDNQYTDKARAPGSVTDIVRRIKYYERIAPQHGLILSEHTEFAEENHSPKHLLVFNKK